MDFTEHPEALKIIDSYPNHVRQKLSNLRRLIIEAAGETGVKKLEEMLKWGEPSYQTKTGSTIRIDWKKKQPDQYAMYFTCTTSLGGTFQLLYGDLFGYEGNRAIVFGMEDQIPEKEFKHCVSLALTYHQVKHLPLLGA